MKKNITKEEVEHVAELAKISLNGKELEDMQEEISNILTYMEILNDIDTDNIKYEEIMSTNTNILRKDEEVKFENVEGIRKNSNLVDGMYQVPDMN